MSAFDINTFIWCALECAWNIEPAINWTLSQSRAPISCYLAFLCVYFWFFIRVRWSLFSSVRRSSRRYLEWHASIYKTIAKLWHITNEKMKTCKCKLNYRPRSNRLSIETTHTHTYCGIGRFFVLLLHANAFWSFSSRCFFFSAPESKLLFTNLTNRYNDCANNSQGTTNNNNKQQNNSTLLLAMEKCQINRK